MNQTPALPPPAGSEAAEEPPPPPSSRRRDLVPWVYGLGFVVLALALVWIWQNPNPSPKAVQPQRVDDIARQVEVLNRQVAQLAERPAPAPFNLVPLEQRIEALEKRLPATPDLAPIEQQVQALRSQLASLPANRAPGPDLGPLESRVQGLEQQLHTVQTLKSQLDTMSRQLASQQAELGPGLARLTADQQALSARVRDLDAALKAEQASVSARLQSAQQEASTAVAAAEKAARLARLQTARVALEAGMPLGAIEGAPPALVRFAEARPPTEAALRLAFPAAEQAALDAARPDTAGKPFGERLWQRAQQLVTIRAGDRVIVGNQAAGVLTEARQELDAGDLTGAVASVAALTGPAAQAMASWLDQARALLAARAALDTMAAHA